MTRRPSALSPSQSTTPYQYEWCADLAGELATIMFYVATGWKFQPQTDNPYFALDSEEEEGE